MINDSPQLFYTPDELRRLGNYKLLDNIFLPFSNICISGTFAPLRMVEFQYTRVNFVNAKYDYLYIMTDLKDRFIEDYSYNRKYK